MVDRARLSLVEGIVASAQADLEDVLLTMNLAESGVEAAQHAAAGDS